MASDGAADGRPMVVLYFADCDPSGWQMAISVSRKLQALKALEFDDLELEVHRVALTPEQVREYGLPSTPLKDTERRADKWTAAMGVEQTEIDALAALQPDVLTAMARDAIAPSTTAPCRDGSGMPPSSGRPMHSKPSTPKAVSNSKLCASPRATG